MKAEIHQESLFHAEKIIKVCNGPQGNIYLGRDDRGLYETELQGVKDIKCNKKTR